MECVKKPISIRRAPESRAERQAKRPRTSEVSSVRAVILCSADYVRACDSHPSHGGRMARWGALMAEFGLLRHEKVRLLAPREALLRELEEFHTREYLDALLATPEGELSAENAEELGLNDDCAPFPGLPRYVRLVAGASLQATEELCSGRASVAMNFGGGRHHAFPGRAAGFCYVNDIVIAILRMMELGKSRVLYLDIDIHHGDAVESAFEFEDRVFTCSFHRYHKGVFFPGTGRMSEIGRGTAKYRQLNVPLLRGCDDRTFCYIFKKVADTVIAGFKPDAIVLQCGVDGLAVDPLLKDRGGYNLTSRAHAHCVRHIASKELPLLLLGGGGYSPAAAAATWTLCASIAISTRVPREIPDTHANYMDYKPSFSLLTPASKFMLNENGKVYCGRVLASLRKFCYGAGWGVRSYKRLPPALATASAAAADDDAGDGGGRSGKAALASFSSSVYGPEPCGGAQVQACQSSISSVTGCGEKMTITKEVLAQDVPAAAGTRGAAATRFGVVARRGVAEAGDGGEAGAEAQRLAAAFEGISARKSVLAAGVTVPCFLNDTAEVKVGNSSSIMTTT